MVTLMPDNANPTRADIDNYIYKIVATGKKTELEKIIREIRMKQASIHPAEQYFYDCVFEENKNKQYK
jgi:hypothetical protein